MTELFIQSALTTSTHVQGTFPISGKLHVIITCDFFFGFRRLRKIAKEDC
jgi:hypothetical protein